MPMSRRSCSASPTLRIELRASRGLAIALVLLGVAGGASLQLSAMPAPWAWLAGLACIAEACRLARRELDRRDRALVFRGDGTVELDGRDVGPVRTSWRGPLCIVRIDVGGAVERLVGWPDVVDRAARRELRLWTLAHRDDVLPAAVAP